MVKVIGLFPESGCSSQPFAHDSTLITCVLMDSVIG